MLRLNYCQSVYKDLIWNVPIAEYHISLKLAPILRDFSLFCQNLLTCLINLQSEMSSSHWPTTKTPCYK